MTLPTPEGAGRARPAALMETHSAVIVLLGERAYKMKKPVNLGFLDFTSLASREHACTQELVLNRRLAPDVYLGNARVVNDHDEVIEYLLVMQRLPQERRLDHLLAAGGHLRDELTRIAETLAAFHQAQPVDEETARAAASPEVVTHLWADCTRGVRQWGPGVVAGETISSVELLAASFINGRRALFEQRISDGNIRDGHGDLQAADVFCLDDGPRLLDCLDFDAALRVGDTASDIAFLAMDLERLGHREEASALLATYLDRMPAPASLVSHYTAYRAWVRCSVACLRADQGDVSARSDAVALAALTVKHLLRSRVMLICVAGLPGSGKSTVAEALVRSEPSWQLLSSDATRVNLQADDRRSTADRYNREHRGDVYRRMLDAAGEFLGIGDTVVVDATFEAASWRAAARELADRTGAVLVALVVTCDPDVARERIVQRRDAGRSASEATVEVLDAMAADWTPWVGAHEVTSEAGAAAALAAARAASTEAPRGR